LADARRAWYDGDAETTLALCDALERDERTATDSALLRARVYLRMQRADDARVLLGSPAERTYYAWRQGNAVRVPMDTLRRVGYIAGIYKALQIVYSDAHLADSWVKRPNKAFGGQSPLDRMRGGDVVDLAAVRTYVDAARAPWS